MDEKERVLLETVQEREGALKIIEDKNKEIKELEAEVERLKEGYNKKATVVQELYEKNINLESCVKVLREELQDAVLELGDKYRPDHRIMLGYKDAIAEADKLMGGGA